MIDLRHGDCLEVLRGMEADSVDAVVTDPPYGLSFMGKGWDYDVPTEDVWRECLRVLKPGGHLLAFAGTRTQHRMAVRIEDAGFEIRDMIAWVYGSGFPKSLDVSKAIDKCNGETGRLLKFTEWMRTTGLTARQIDNITRTNMGGHYLTAASQPAIPTPALWALLRPHCGEVPEWVDQLVQRIEAEREVVGKDTKARSTSGASALPTMGGETVYQSWNITAPATDAARQWQGWGTALKPALEPITVARKPLVGTVAENVLRHGTGAINVDGCRVGYASDADKEQALSGDAFKRKDTSDKGWSRPWMEDAERVERMNREAKERAQGGRWPANLIHDGSEEVVGLFPKSVSRSSAAVHRSNGVLKHGGENSRPSHGTTERVTRNEGFNDSGSAARFFYCAKASKADRDEGLDAGSHRAAGVGDERPSGSSEERRGKKAVQPRANIHPTVKPTALMRYLCRLVTPPNGIVLDPFMGSGSTGKAAILEGFRFVGIEREADYIEIARARIEAAQSKAGLLEGS